MADDDAARHDGILLARSVPAVRELLPQLAGGALAVVSSVFGPDTDEVIGLLKDTGGYDARPDPAASRRTRN